jgi:hypothetical protein
MAWNKSATHGGVPTSADGANDSDDPRSGGNPNGDSHAVPVAPMPMAMAVATVAGLRDAAGGGCNSARQSDARSRRNAA